MAEPEKEEESADYTGINILTFVIITVIYYSFLKPVWKLQNLKDADSVADTARNQKYMAAIYFMIVLFFQFVINANSMTHKCGGSLGSNIAAAAGMTVWPWIFIFGIMMLFIMAFPGMKTAFSDVIGYFAVSYSANNLLADLLIDTEVDAQLKAENVDDKTREAMQSAAQAIVKLMGNVSILVNQVVPGNFIKYWETLTPLMKPKYANDPDGAATLAKKEKFLELATFRDNIGEACWYLYTGIFLIMIIQNNIVTYKCDTDPRLMNAKYDEYQKQQREKEEAAKNEEVAYRM